MRRKHAKRGPMVISVNGKVWEMADVSEQNCEFCEDSGPHEHQLRHLRREAP